MKKKAALIINDLPYQNQHSEETIKLALIASEYWDLSLFFLNEGVVHLISNDSTVDAKNYTAVFKAFDLYEIKHVYVCGHSLTSLGYRKELLFINTEIISPKTIKKLLSEYEIVF